MDRSLALCESRWYHNELQNAMDTSTFGNRGPKNNSCPAKMLQFWRIWRIWPHLLPFGHGNHEKICQESQLGHHTALEFHLRSCPTRNVRFQHINNLLSPTLVTSVFWKHGIPNVIARYDGVTSGSHQASFTMRFTHLDRFKWFFVLYQNVAFPMRQIANHFLHFVTSAVVSNAFCKLGSFLTNY